MKTTGVTDWKPPNEGAINSSNFNSLPGGGNGYQNNFEGLGIGGHFWNSTQDGANAVLPTLHYKYASILLLNAPKTVIASVRCVQD